MTSLSTHDSIATSHNDTSQVNGEREHTRTTDRGGLKVRGSDSKYSVHCALQVKGGAQVS